MMQDGNWTPGKAACLVLGEGVTALGAQRSLGRAGIPAYIWTSRGDVSSHSRWSRPAKSLSNLPLRQDTLGKWLGSVSDVTLVLMPCSDDWTLAVAGLDELPGDHIKRWNVGLPIINKLVNKDEFRATLEALSLPHPRTFALDDPGSFETIPDDAFEYAFLKPHESQGFFAKHAVKGIFVDSKAAAASKFGELAAEGFSFVLQEYVPGPPTAHYFIDGYRPRSEPATRYLARQRLRMYPPDFGNSTDMVTVGLKEVEPALATLETLFDSIGYFGIFSAEFKKDSRDGAFRIVEVNCRPWWYVEYADQCGLHACKYAFQESLGLPLEPYSSYTIGKRGVYPAFDRYARKENEGDDEADRGFLDMMTAWLFGFTPVFSWSDPMPGIRSFFQHFADALRTRSS